MIRAGKHFALAAALVALAIHGGCAPGRRAPARPNILLITIDTLRADRLSCYGHDKPTSPFLDSLAADGIRFEHAYATSSWTTPSVVSMITSTYQNRHRMGGRVRGVPTTWSRIPDDLPNLAESLRQGGYRTYGLVANTNLAAERGFDRGFDRYRCLGTADREEVDEAITPWIADIAGGEGPWFLWLHMLDPHGPYNARQPWVREFEPDYSRFKLLDGMPSEKFAARASRLNATQLDVVRAIYDSEIRDSDEFLRDLFDRLPGAADAFVLFTSDHGEEFLEHGGTLHGRTLYEESIRVPFIVRPPDRHAAGTVVNEVVSLIDVLPTILGAAGLTPDAEAAGINLVGSSGVAVPAGRIVVAEILRGMPERATIDRRFKFITKARTPDSPELYDLATDAGEQTDLAVRHGDEVARYRQVLEMFERVHTPDASPQQQADISPEQLEALRALGYVGAE